MPYIGNTPAEKYAAFDVQYFTTSATASYTLDHAVANELDIRLVINNVIQEPGSGKAYTATGTTLTLSAATAGTDTMYCVYTAKASQTVNPPAGSVGTSQLADDAVNSAKLSSTAVDNTNTNSTLITAQTAKTSLVDADKFLISDSAASGALKYVEKQYMPSGAMTFLSSTDLSSGVAEFLDVDFFTTYSTYKHFILDVQLICPSSNSNLKFIFQNSGGDVGTHQAEWKGQRNNASDEDGGTNGGSSINLFGNSASNNGDGINMIIELWQPIGSSNGDINMMWRATGGQAQQNYWLFQTGGGTSESGNSATGFVIKRASGNLTTSGNYSYVKIYGVQST